MKTRELLRIRKELIKPFAELSQTEIPIMEAARRAHAAHPEHYPSVEVARSAIRHYNGSNGHTSRLASKEVYISSIADGLKKLYAHSTPRNKPIVIREGVIGVLSDIHIPHHDTAALTIAIEDLKRRECTHIVLNGDILDCMELSNFDKTGREATFMSEIETGREFLRLLRREFANATIIYNQGNHEVRLQRYLQTRASAIAHLDVLQLPSLLKCDESGVIWTQGQPIKAGKLNILHGHERKQGFAPSVNPARGAFLWGKGNVLVGHHHQISEHLEGTIDERQIGAWSTGCLCGLRPEYSPFAYLKWGHGYAVVTVKSGGRFTVENIKIIQDRLG